VAKSKEHSLQSKPSQSRSVQSKSLQSKSFGKLEGPDFSAVVRKHMPLVRRIARRYSNFSQESIEDLMQVGAIGLLKAIRYYNPNRSRVASFQTLATYYVQGEIRHYLRDHCSLVQVPRKFAEVNSFLSRLEERLSQTLKHTPSVHELSRHSGLSVGEILEAQVSWEARLHYESLDPVVSEADEREDRRSLSELVPDRKDQDRQVNEEERELINQALRRLGDRNRQVLEFVFFYDLSQKETASVLGLSEMGVSRAINSGLRKLKEILGRDERI
jgi:RNA polymerase sigma-B factor